MLKLVTKYGLAAHLAFLAVAPLFLSPVPILWLSALGLIWLMMEPSRIGSEMLHDARRRVWRSLRTDPLFWVLLALVVLSGVRALNTGIAMAYDAEMMKWRLSPPSVPFLPGSVEGKGFVGFAIAVATWVTLSGCRHALGKKARVAFVLSAGLFASVILLLGLFFVDTSRSEFLKAVSCPLTEPLYPGVAYGILFLLSLPNLAAVFENRWWKVFLFAILALLGSAVGLVLYAPPTAIALFAAAGIILILYDVAYLRFKVSKTSDSKYLVFCGIALAIAGMTVMTVLPADVFSAKTEPFMTGDFFEKSFFEIRRTLSDVSLRIWSQAPWLGTGLGSFPQALAFNAEPADWTKISALQIAPLNGYWLLLAERGVIGAFVLVVPLALLLLTWIRRLISAFRVIPHPSCLLAPLMLIVIVAEALFDGSFLLPEVVIPFAVALSISASSFTKESRRDGQ